MLLVYILFLKSFPSRLYIGIFRQHSEMEEVNMWGITFNWF
jgi:hypothetical protein